MILSMAPLLSVLTEFDFTLLKAAVLFLNREWDARFDPFWSIKHKILSKISTVLLKWQVHGVSGSLVTSLL